MSNVSLVKAVLLLAAVWTSSASAGLKVCNKSDLPLSVAFGWEQTSGWQLDAVITKGWWHIAPGQCDTWTEFDGTAYASGAMKYHYFAYDSGGGWSGPRQLCVHMGENFMEPRFRHTERECNAGVLRGFKQLTIDAETGTLFLEKPH